MSVTNYQSAGVNISAGNDAIARIKTCVEDTFSESVLTPLGGFGALYDLKTILQNYQQPVLVQSIDGVGTKMIVAEMLQKFDTIGIDLVSATVNDIVVIGAKPLIFLDYIANAQLDPVIIEQIVTSIAKACRQHDIALIGGETAEMPGVYLPGRHDLVGVITGVVEKEKAILGKSIVPHDLVLGLPSSGLHTNGFSLARKLFFEHSDYQVTTILPEYQQTLGEVLLMPHTNYAHPIQHLLAQGIKIKGMAHITGGGLLENIPRILPAGCSVMLNKKTWPILPIFNLIQSLAKLDPIEMHRTFNMGVGLVLVISPDELDATKRAMQMLSDSQIYEIGEVVPGEKTVSLI